MNKVLVAGIESVVGGNLAVSLARSFPVTGVSLAAPVTFTGCEIDSPCDASMDSIRATLNRVQPHRIVFCGAGSQMGWDSGAAPGASDVTLAAAWIQAARDSGIHLTLISSGALFTGPWMFHAENSQSFCSSGPAQALQAIETEAQQASTDSLIVRTHAFGWAPGGQQGWLESLFEQLERGGSTNLDCFRHASPILASDLADILVRSWTAGLSGIYHIAGAERANPVQFARRVAHHFQLPSPTAPTGEFLVDRPSGFGCGETSLQTRKIRRALHVTLPMLEDGVARLFQQHVDGYRARLTGTSTFPTSRVA